MIEIRFDKTKDEVALLIWFLVDHSVDANWAWSVTSGPFTFAGVPPSNKRTLSGKSSTA
jgi:hypothetical protein